MNIMKKKKEGIVSTKHQGKSNSIKRKTSYATQTIQTTERKG